MKSMGYSFKKTMTFFIENYASVFSELMFPKGNESNTSYVQLNQEEELTVY